VKNLHVTIEITFFKLVKKVPDGVFDEPKRLAHCCTALSVVFDGIICLSFNIVNMNQNRI